MPKELAHLDTSRWSVMLTAIGRMPPDLLASAMSSLPKNNWEIVVGQQPARTMLAKKVRAWFSALEQVLKVLWP